jgi:hypothetical protein
MVTKKKAAPAKKLSVKKSSVKDMSVKAGKSKDVKGGGGRYKASNPKTPSDPGCVPCE